MMMKTFAFAITLAFAAATAPANAAVRSDASLTCGVGYVCTIELPAGVSIQGDPFMFGGCRVGSDRKTGCLWQLDWSQRGVRTPLVVLTPNYDGLRTNILIQTDRGNYNVDLKSDARGGRSSVSFASGAAVVAPTPPPGLPGPNTETVPSAADVLRVAQAVNPEPHWETWQPDYCATIQGHPDFKPIWVSNDGARTMIAMPYHMNVSPTIFALMGSQRVEAQPARLGRIWIIDGTPDAVELIVGTGSAAQRVLERKGSC